MLSVSSVALILTTSTTRGQVVVDKRKNPIKRSFNVMQHSPVVVFMCVQHSQQQVPMLNNFMCMRMRGWHYNSYSNNCHLIKGTGTTGTTSTKTLLKRSNGLRKKRDIIIRRNICCRLFRFWTKGRKINHNKPQFASQKECKQAYRKFATSTEQLATSGSNMMGGKSNPPHSTGHWH